MAGVTAFYLYRLYETIVGGAEHKHEHTPHEAPKTMTLPLIFLATVTVFAGFIPFGKFVSSDGADYIIHLDWQVAITSVVIAIAAIVFATVLYRKHNPLPEKMAAAVPALYSAASKRFYLDELYLFVTKKIIFRYISRPLAWFDRHVVDGTMNGIAYVTEKTSFAIRGLQTGQLQLYALLMLAGILVIVLLVLL
jgi:NADH-quinone oxidoreductase subunit L